MTELPSLKTHTFILPESFDVLELLPKSLHRFADDGRYVASTILWKTSRGKADDYGYVPLKAEFLRKVISERRGRDVIQSLLSTGAIHRTTYYVVGEKSYAYRLDDRYRADQHIRLPIENKRLLRNLERQATACRAEANRRMRPIHHILASLQHGLIIDGQESKAILTRLPSTSNPFDCQGVLVQDILEKRFRLSVGQFGRVSNNITNLKREIRTALRYAGQPLAGVDIACAQPSLLCLLCRMCQKNVTSYDDMLLLAPVVPPCPAALSPFWDACRKGELYGLLGLRLRDAGVDWDRDKVKRRFLTDVLAKRKASVSGAEYPSEIEKVFKAEYPKVWQFIRDANADGWEHARLIRQLQQLESWVVIEQVCGEFVLRHPGEFVITIHDAVYCRPEMLEALIESFEIVFSRLDFRPQLKLEGNR